MARSVRAKVKAGLLAWARESAGYTPVEAGKRIGVTEKRIAEWESGALAPTVGQLQTIAEAYKRPLSLFYLQEPPTTFQPMRDFRRLPGSGLRRFSPDLALEIRLAQQRRALALELLEAAGDKPSRVRIAATLDDDPEAIGERIRKALHVSSGDRLEWRSDPAGYAAFNAWRSRIEDLGILVFQSSRVSAEEVSGFAIAEPVLSVIVVTRSQTSPKRRTFSLLHEFVHLLLHMSGVSDLDVDAKRPPEDQRIEVFCNQAAAAALIPKDDLLAEDLVKGHKGKSNWPESVIKELARNYSVSREALVRRLMTFGLATTSFYQTKRREYLAEFQRRQSELRLKSKESGEEFRTNPPRDTLTNFGKPLVRMILESYYRDQMSLSDVSGYLGIRTRHIPNLELIVGFRGG